MPYAASTDPYRYKNSDVLKNIPGIRDGAALAAFETVSAAQRADEPLPLGSLGVRHYRAVHRHLFQDVYRWAGRYRTVRLSKGDSMFCYPENIAAQMLKLFARLKRRRDLSGLSPRRFAQEAAGFLTDLNAIHPFREGNGRTQLTFMMLLADRAGRPFDLRKLDARRFLAAMVKSFGGNEAPLRRELSNLIGRAPGKSGLRESASR